jgi:hypothetical protein
MNDASEAEMSSDGASETTAPLSFAGPVRLIAGENASAYDDLLVRVTAALKPADIIEQIWVRDVVDLVWDTLRLRRLKASLLAARAHAGLEKVLIPLDSDSFDTSRRWQARDPDAIERVESILASAGMSMDNVMAETLSEKMDDIVRIDRMTMAAEARRSAILREIDGHRTGFGERLRAAVNGAGTIELNAIEQAPALEGA